jgi:hypothetical protein
MLMAVGIATAMGGCANERAATNAPQESTARATLPIVLHFATENGRDAVDPGRVGVWLAHTQMMLRPHGVDVELVDVRALPLQASASGIIGRYRLLDHVEDAGVLHVMVLDELGGSRRDGTATVRGLHFRAPLRGQQYIAVGPGATTTTMLHEIGHAFGLDHESDPDNVMCSCDRTDNPKLTPAQGDRIRRAVSRR